MNLLEVPTGSAVELNGSPFERGRQQAELFPSLVGRVQAAIKRRLQESASTLSRPSVRNYLHALRLWAEDNDVESMEEILGISEGFGLEASQVFDYLCLSLADDLDPDSVGVEITAEECTAWAVSHPTFGAIVAKNRDYHSEHRALQHVFHHRDPHWAGREVLCVGSLGSPGNFSSGFNSYGLAVADTASHTMSHGIGRHRYFLLTGLLVRCSTVAEALDDIASVPHAGGGLLVLGDATGTVATVELGHQAVTVEIRRSGWVGRTNHFTTELMSPFTRPSSESLARNSEARLVTLRDLTQDVGGVLGPTEVAQVLSDHGNAGGAALCRHGGEHLGETISAHIYATRLNEMWFADGNPCNAPWKRFGFDADGTGEAGRRGS